MTQTRTRRSRRWLVALVAPAMAVALVGCSSSDSGGSSDASDGAAVAADAVAAQIVSTFAAEKVPVDKGSVACPGPLASKVGETLRCEFTSGDQPVDAVATVTKLDGSTVGFDITAEARPVPQAIIEREVVSQMKANGITIDSAACKGELPAKADSTVSCTATGGGETVDVTARAESIDGGTVHISIGA